MVYLLSGFQFPHLVKLVALHKNFSQINFIEADRLKIKVPISYATITPSKNVIQMKQIFVHAKMNKDM